jgi:hypothetical protein
MKPDLVLRCQCGLLFTTRHYRRTCEEQPEYAPAFLLALVTAIALGLLWRFV